MSKTNMVRSHRICTRIFLDSSGDLRVTARLQKCNAMMHSFPYDQPQELLCCTRYRYLGLVQMSFLLWQKHLIICYYCYCQSRCCQSRCCYLLFHSFIILVFVIIYKVGFNNTRCKMQAYIQHLQILDRHLSISSYCYTSAAQNWFSWTIFFLFSLCAFHLLFMRPLSSLTHKQKVASPQLFYHKC